MIVGDRNEIAQCDRKERAAWLCTASFLLLPLAFAVPVFAHGCHTGDHDDEPLVAPRSQDAEPAK